MSGTSQQTRALTYVVACLSEVTHKRLTLQRVDVEAVRACIGDDKGDHSDLAAVLLEEVVEASERVDEHVDALTVKTEEREE